MSGEMRTLTIALTTRDIEQWPADLRDAAGRALESGGLPDHVVSEHDWLVEGIREIVALFIDRVIEPELSDVLGCPMDVS